MHSTNLHINFDSFFNSYYKAVYFFALKYIKDEDKVEDIVLESFVKVWERREKFESDNGMKSYLYRVVYTGCLKELKRHSTVDRRQKEYVTKADSIEKDHLENMIKAETLRLVYEAMEELPSECRKVFKKLFVEGKTTKQTAEELNVSVSTINNQKMRGIKLLRVKMNLRIWLLMFVFQFLKSLI